MYDDPFAGITIRDLKPVTMPDVTALVVDDEEIVREALEFLLPEHTQRNPWRVYTAANVDQAWIGTNGRKLLKRKTRCPVMLLNDADAAGLAEVTFGAGRGQEGVVIVLTFGTGIGSGIPLAVEWLVLEYPIDALFGDGESRRPGDEWRRRWRKGQAGAARPALALCGQRGTGQLGGPLRGQG